MAVSACGSQDSCARLRFGLQTLGCGQRATVGGGLSDTALKQRVVHISGGKFCITGIYVNSDAAESQVSSGQADLLQDM